MAQSARGGLGARFAAGVDRFFASTLLGRSRRSRKKSRAESLGPEAREAALRQLVALYDREEHFGPEPESFVGPVLRATMKATPVRSLRGGGRVLDLEWASEYGCHVADVTERYASAPNERAHARVFLHDDGRPRPAVLLVHGYLGGIQAIEERTWPLRWLYGKGFDVALPVLPFHGPRRAGLRPRWPSSDPRVNVEGFRHAVHDLRALRGWLSARGASAVGAMGMSLGGYSTALLATVDPELAFVVPFIPLVSIADWAKNEGRYVGTPEQQALQHELLERAHRVVSPLARAPRLPRERIVVVAGEADRITTFAQAERLAAHFGVPVVAFPGGHLLQLGRAEGFRAVGRMLGAAGLLDAR